MNARRRIALGEYVDDQEPIDPLMYFQSLPPTQNHLKQPYTLKSIRNIKNNHVSLKETSITEVRPQQRIKKSKTHTPTPQEKSAIQKEFQQIQLPSDSISGVRLSGEHSNKEQNTKPENRRGRLDYRLKEIITKQKVTGLLSKFKNKIMRNNQYLEPVECNAFEAQELKNFLQNEGFEIVPLLDNTIALLSIIQITLLFFMYTLSIVFSELEQNFLLNFLQIFSIFFYFLEIVYNSVTIKSTGGRRLKTFKQIIDNYLSNSLVIDLMSFFIMIIDINTNVYLMKYFRLFIVTKLPQCLQKMEKLQVFFIKTYHNQQYWSLAKVFLFNFCFAHILAIFLTAVAGIDPNNNWYSCKDIYGGSWFEKYVWGYYWGVNIMLTVGFGDIVATNYRQALCLIFIEIISVICLAYNINWVGTLISNIRAQDLEKSKNFKTFKQLTDKYQLPPEIEWKINNYIEESVNIRKKFNVEEEHTFIKHLPETLKKEYLQENNKTIFQELPFFGSLIDRTLYNFAEKIEMSISHPEQILKKIEDNFNLMILREGSIGYMPKRRNCRSNGMVIDRVKIYDEQKPFILGLEFLTQRRPTYQIKSLQYSVIYNLQYQTLKGILKESQMDYEHFCMLRDKNKSLIDQFQVLKCENCKNQKHTKFTCPRLHYIPIHQISIFKEQRLQKISKNPRVSDYDMRLQPKRMNALLNNRTMVELLRDGPGRNADKTMVIQGGKKFENSFLTKLSQLKKIKDSTDTQGASEDIKDVFLKNASELIKSQFDRFFRKESFEDEIWLINCDKMKNYKEYFVESNPINLELSFSLEERLERLNNYESETENVPNCYSIGPSVRTNYYLEEEDELAEDSF